MPPALEEGGQATHDELLEINLDSDEEPRPTFISGSMSSKKKDMYLEFLKQNRGRVRVDIFGNAETRSRYSHAPLGDRT